MFLVRFLVWFGSVWFGLVRFGSCPCFYFTENIHTIGNDGILSVDAIDRKYTGLSLRLVQLLSVYLVNGCDRQKCTGSSVGLLHLFSTNTNCDGPILHPVYFRAIASIGHMSYRV